MLFSPRIKAAAESLYICPLEMHIVMFDNACLPPPIHSWGALGDLRSVLELAPQDMAEEVLTETLRRDESPSGLKELHN